MRDIMKLLFWIGVIVAIIALGPLVTIWAVNTLFPTLAIPYALDTWFAVVVIGAFFRANVTVKR